MMVEKTLTYKKTVTVKYQPYPKVRLICGEVVRLEKPESILEKYYQGRWRAA